MLPKLSDGAYDLVFVDGDKLEYAEYVEQAVRLLRHGGVLAVDNALLARPGRRSGHRPTTRPKPSAPRWPPSRENEDLVSALLPVGDGLLVAVKR